MFRTCYRDYLHSNIKTLQKYSAIKNSNKQMNTVHDYVETTLNPQGGFFIKTRQFL